MIIVGHKGRIGRAKIKVSRNNSKTVVFTKVEIFTKVSQYELHNFDMFTASTVRETLWNIHIILSHDFISRLFKQIYSKQD